MTPAEEAGWKVGDEGIIIGSLCVFDVGDRVVLYVDDGSEIPFFNAPSLGKQSWVDLNKVKKVERADAHHHAENMRLYAKDAAETETLAGVEFPEPMREEPIYGSKYFLADVTTTFASPVIWEGDSTDMDWLRCGICQATAEGAEAQRQAMIASVGGSVDDD